MPDDALARAMGTVKECLYGSCDHQDHEDCDATIERALRAYGDEREQAAFQEVIDEYIPPETCKAIRARVGEVEK